MIVINNPWETEWHNLVREWRIRSGEEDRLGWCKGTWNDWEYYTRVDSKEVRRAKMETVWNLCMEVLDH